MLGNPLDACGPHISVWQGGIQRGKCKDSPLSGSLLYTPTLQHITSPTASPWRSSIYSLAHSWLIPGYTVTWVSILEVSELDQGFLRFWSSGLWVSRVPGAWNNLQELRGFRASGIGMRCLYMHTIEVCACKGTYSCSLANEDPHNVGPCVLYSQ